MGNLYFIELGVTTFLTSGTLGFDIMAAGTVLRLKRAFPHIRLILVLPQKTRYGIGGTAHCQHIG